MSQGKQGIIWIELFDGEVLPGGQCRAVTGWEVNKSFHQWRPLTSISQSLLYIFSASILSKALSFFSNQLHEIFSVFPNYSLGFILFFFFFDLFSSKQLTGKTFWKFTFNNKINNVKNRPIQIRKGPYSQGYGFSSGHVWMWELDCEESWELKNWWGLNCGVGEDSWESLGLQGDPTSPS